MATIKRGYFDATYNVQTDLVFEGVPDFVYILCCGNQAYYLEETYNKTTNCVQQYYATSSSNATTAMNGMVLASRDGDNLVLSVKLISTYLTGKFHYIALYFD